MINIETARPTTKKILSNISEIEDFCLGSKSFSPELFREINEELSIGAVLMVGKRRYQREADGKRLFWLGLDNNEHDMGMVHDARVKRYYPGFHASSSRSLGGDHVSDNEIITAPNGRGNISIVTMTDGSKGIGPNYRIALRNAALKMHLKSKFNYFSLSGIWNNIIRS